MVENTSTLAEIAQQKSGLQKQLEQLETQETEEWSKAASAAHADVVSLVEAYGNLLTTRQRDGIAALLGAKSTRTGGEEKPKYELSHTRETWSGRGRMPRAFSAWERTATYREWKAQHPNLRFPLYRV